MNSRHVPVLVLVGLVARGASAQCSDAASQGCWGAEINASTSPAWPSVYTIHSVLLKTGKVLCVSWATGESDDLNVSIFDPTTGISTAESSWQQQNQPGTFEPALDLFCSGHAQLPDGKVDFVGEGSLPGTRYTMLFNPDLLPANPWTKLDDIGLTAGQPQLAHERWYPTCTALANGKILVTGGRNFADDPCDVSAPFEPGNTPLILDVNQPSGQQWTWLDESARLDLMWYPFVFQTVAAGVFMGGSNYFDRMPCSNPNVS